MAVLMMDREEVKQARQEFARLKESYRRAVEAALARVPVRNGVVSVRDLWLETSLPVDLIVELLRENGIRLPPHVKRVDVDQPLGRRKGGHGKRR